MLLKSERPPQLRASRGDYVIDWIETHCVYTVGRWLGKPVNLLEWQKDFIRLMFAVDPTSGMRWYRWVLLGVPKKNGKTELAGWLALYFMIGDNEPGAWVACAASADHQADLVFGAAKRCAEWSPTLSKVCVATDREITVPSLPGARLVRVTAGTGTNDGPSWHAIICDELHEWPDPKGTKLWEILTNGIGGREQPIILQITTAGFDLETVCGQQYLLGKQLVQDHTIDPYYLFYWFEPDDENVDHSSLDVWKDVNPSWGATLPYPEKYLRDQFTKKTESTFRRYFLNQWVEAEDLWLPYGTWDQCEDQAYDLDPELPLYVGVDGALKRDTFAIVAWQRQEIDDPDELERFEDLYRELGIETPARFTRDVIRSWMFENPYPRGHPAHEGWKLNLQEPMTKLRELRQEFQQPAAMDEDEWEIEGPIMGYDPYALELVASDLRDEGLNMVEFPQTDARMCPASELVYEKVVTGVVAHDGSPRLRRHIQSAVPKVKERGWRITRPKGVRQPIDGCTAFVMAGHLAYTTPEPEENDGPSIW